MDDAAKRLVDALRASLAGNLKGAAMNAYPNTSEKDAGSRAAKWWDGTLNPPPSAYVDALTGETCAPLLAVLADLADVDFAPRRRDPAALLDAVAEDVRDLRGREQRIEEQLDLLTSLLSERRGPAKARRDRDRDRGIA